MFINNFLSKQMWVLPLLLLLGCLLGGCVTEMQENPKKTMGSVIGAGLGALTGSQIGSGKGQLVSVAVGTLAGAWFGGEIGQSLDKADRAYMERNTQKSLEYSKVGSAMSWKNPDTGNSGTITPTQTFQKVDGQNCREFEQTVYANGKEEKAVGRACREKDGSWKIIS